MQTFHYAMILSKISSGTNLFREFAYAKIKYSLATAILFNCENIFYLFVSGKGKNNIFNAPEQLCNGDARSIEGREK